MMRLLLTIVALPNVGYLDLAGWSAVEAGDDLAAGEIE